jgi:hypothetical protein
MRIRVLALVLWAFTVMTPSSAHAQLRDYMSPFLSGGGVSPIVGLFTAPAAGSYASITPTNGGAITCSRPSTATYIDGVGTRQTAASNTCRVETAGLFSEGPSTNYLLNSSATVTQTTASLGTGAYTGWVEGSGSLAFTAGTATATGLPCTATTGIANDCHFTITGAGTVVATKSGVLTLEQLEPLAVRSSYIPSGGTATTRPADAISMTVAAIGPYFSASATMTRDQAPLTSAITQTILGFGTGSYGGANTSLFYAAPTLHLDTFDGTGASRTTASGSSYDGASHKFQISAAPALGVNIDGSLMPGYSQSGTGNGIGSLTVLGIGTGPGNFTMFAHYSAVCVANTPTGCTP